MSNLHNPNKLRNLNKILITSALAFTLALIGCAGGAITTHALPPPPNVGTVQLSGDRVIKINSSDIAYKVNIPAWQLLANVLDKLPGIATGQQFTLIDGGTATGFHLTHQAFKGEAQFNLFKSGERAKFIGPEERKFMTDDIPGMTFAPPGTPQESFVVVNEPGTTTTDPVFKTPLESTQMTAATELAQVILSTDNDNPNTPLGPKDIINNAESRIWVFRSQGLSCSQIGQKYPNGFRTLGPSNEIITFPASDFGILCADIDEAIAQTANGQPLEPLLTEK